MVERVVLNALEMSLCRRIVATCDATKSGFLRPRLRGGAHRLEDKTIHLYAQSLGNQNAVKHIEKPLHKQRQ